MQTAQKRDFFFFLFEMTRSLIETYVFQNRKKPMIILMFLIIQLQHTYTYSLYNTKYCTFRHSLIHQGNDIITYGIKDKKKCQKPNF